VFGRVTILDDRGASVPLFDERDVRTREDREAVVAAVAAQRLPSNAHLNRSEVAGALLPIALFIGVFIVYQQWIRPVITSRVVEALAFLVPFFAAVYCLRGIDRRGKAARVRVALLKIGRCPSCGYALAGVEAEPDGCRVCPECGGAWRVEV